MPSLFERVVSSLFGSSDEPSDADRQLIDDTTDAFVETVEPRVRLSSSYREKLAGNVGRTIAYLRELATKLPSEPIVLSRATWSTDPRVRTFFAAANDVQVCIGRCDEVREFFDSHSGCNDAYALLGMQRKDRTVLAPRLEGEVLKQDVQQTTVSFSGHRLLAAGPDFAQTRLEVGRRIMERLAELVLARVVDIDKRVNDLNLQKAQLATRLRMLRSARGGMRPLVGNGSSVDQQILEVERQVKQASDDHAAAKSSLDTLDDYIEHMNAVLAHPEQVLALTRSTLRVNRMGVKVEPGGSDDADDVDLSELSIGDGLQAVIAFVRIPRDELPPKEDLLAQAQRAI